MLKYLGIFTLFINSVFSYLNEPFNFHTAIANKGIVVSWSTKYEYRNKPIVEYGFEYKKLKYISKGISINYDISSTHHHVLLKNLNSYSKYYFKAGDGIIMSNINTFISQPNIDTKNLRIAIYGDMGVENSNITMERIKDIEYDMLIHLGDISYADDKGLEIGNNKYYENTYNTFMASVEIFSKNQPYMVCPGNHDISCHSVSDLGCPYNLRNFTAFNSRFKMPENGVKNMWYSYDYGPIHFISINTETDYPKSPTNPSTIIGSGSGGDFGNQLEWLENDLIKANKNRNIIPWIIVYGHRPLYSKIIFDWPLNAQKYTKRAFEPLFNKYNVNIYISGHVHAYERNNKIFENEINDNGTYHIICGSPGSQEKIDKHGYILEHKYNLFSNYKDYGWGELFIYNKTTLEWRFYNSKDGNINDSFIFKL